MARGRAERRRSAWGAWLAIAVAGVLVWVAMHGHGGASGDAAAAPSSSASGSPSAGGASAGGPSPSTSGTGGSWYHGSYDPSQFAAQARDRAHEAGVDPQLVMAVLYDEDYKPHDPSFEKAWLKLKPTAALGLANMHQATFDQVKQGRPFADRSWLDLPDDPDLAIRAEAWYLHDLADELPAHHVASLTTDELLALGYNTGPGNMLAFARGVALGPQAQQYLDTTRSNWEKAGKAIAI
ncbi:transglycosylase SLT domain-containing protein [Streptacidiphilus neutrinimicus]|uniref:transglycosylase SLT domain-containing protein n=1 Tax=Streptacidiphilus neutrinimicus TaxID=105420 RepID=UPI0005A605D6|nr:transglycosylase SLT domain-containing protein [Streptacidiphilus neutrinimicus]